MQCGEALDAAGRLIPLDLISAGPHIVKTPNTETPIHGACFTTRSFLYGHDWGGQTEWWSRQIYWAVSPEKNVSILRYPCRSCRQQPASTGLSELP